MVSSEQVKIILEETGITQKKCSDKTGIQQQYLNEFLRGKRLLSSEHMVALEHYIDKIKTII